MEVKHKWIIIPKTVSDDEVDFATNENADPNCSNINTMNISSNKYSEEEMSQRIHNLMIAPFLDEDKNKSKTPFKQLTELNMNNTQQNTPDEIQPRRGQTYLPPKNSMFSLKKNSTEERELERNGDRNFKARPFQKNYLRYAYFS